MKAGSGFALLLSLWLTSGTLSAQNVIEDQGVGISKEELEYIIKYWTPEFQKLAANDRGDRIELLNRALSSKKLELEARQLTPEKDGEVYWQSVFVARNALNRFMSELFLKNLEIPGMTELAKERYTTEKEKYAWVTEQRLSSHILVACGKADCQGMARTDKSALAAKILEELNAGGDFEALVEQYSDDTGTKKNKGLFDLWLTVDQPNIAPKYLEGVFAMEGEGTYSSVVSSRFGFHIIRLEGIRAGHYRSFEEVAPTIIADLVDEYRKLSAKAFDAKYRLTENAYIDHAAVEKILSQYVTPEQN